MDEGPLVVRGLPLPRIVGRGKPKGTGCNVSLLKKMATGDCIWEVPANKANSIRVSAQKAGIKISIRKQPDSDKYSIWKL